MPRICIVPRVQGAGGMASFRLKLESGLVRRGIGVTHDASTALSASPAERPDALLVIGGTRDVMGLWQARRRGVRIVHRLDGINWIHRVRRISSPHGRSGAARLWLRSESANLLLAFIRRRLADRVVYQSEFVRDWWTRRYSSIRQLMTVIYNGVDLGIYTPEGADQPPIDRVRVMVVEGSLAEGQEAGLPWAMDFARALQERTLIRTKQPVELVIAARVSPEQQAYWAGHSAVPVTFRGLVPREQIPALDRAAHIYFSAEVNPPCPNSVIEALACGLPVAGFAMGALPELVTPQAGCLVEYGGDPWKLDPPDIPALADAAADLLEDLPRYRAGARARAETLFGLDQMVERYLEVLLG
jgi:glycosyltransferase involved in cell wall biosynthesis